jgi:4-hydroxybenzoate polyprenyltransferase
MVAKWWSRIRKPIFSLLEVLGFLTGLYLAAKGYHLYAACTFAAVVVFQHLPVRKSVA